MSNLVKSFFINPEVTDPKVIDNNELSDMRIQESNEVEMKRRAKIAAQVQAQINYGDDEEGEYAEGMEDDAIERLTADQGDIPSEMNLADFNDDEGMMEEPVMNQAPVQEEMVPEKIQREADQILEDAQYQASQIVSDARKEASQIQDKARNDGHQEGFDAGYREGVQQAQAEVEQQLAQRAQELDEQFDLMCRSIEPEMVETLTRIYEHVFDVSFREDKEIIMHLLQTALSRVETNGGLLVHISPDDYDMITDHKEELAQSVTNPEIALELVEDPTLSENECIIETDGGIFDCSVGVELEELSRKLKLLSFDRR